MSTAATAFPAMRAAHSLARSWYDAPPSRAVLILLAGFVAIWTLFQIISHAGMGIHFDVGEVYAWSRHPELGYYKHPPLAGWIGTLWFSIFPVADWSFYLLAMANAGLALFAVDLIARRYLDGDKRLIALQLLLLTPFYQFHAERFSTNQTLLSLWPLATYCFLRAFETRAASWSAAAGAATALAMLGKYYSVYLVASFVLAALLHPARAAYLRSSSPWISAAVGLTVFAPHVFWLVSTGFQPFSYAYGVHGAPSFLVLVAKSGSYITSAIAYVAVLLAAYALVVRPDRHVLRETFWPAQPRNRMLVVLLAAQVLLPPLTAPLLGMRITGLWSMSAWFLLPVVLLAPTSVRLRRRAAEGMAVFVFLFAVVALLLAPAVAMARFSLGDKSGREYYRPLSEELTRMWREQTGRPLSIVRGPEPWIVPITVYSPDRPDAMPAPSAAPWVTTRRLEREGWVFVCPEREPACREELETHAQQNPRATRTAIEISPRLLGLRAKTERFHLVLVPPTEPRRP